MRYIGGVAVLLNRQGIHIGAQHDNRTRAAAVQQPNNTGAAYMGSHFDAKAAQRTGHKVGRARFSKRQFRVLVQIPTPAHKLKSQTFGLGTQLRDNHDSLTPP
jgi:hypothetical protein